jgi:hypothetical protein
VGTYGNGVDPTSVYEGEVTRGADVSLGVDTTGVDRISISFDVSAANLDAGEQWTFEVSYDGGTNWNVVYTGTNQPWATQTYDLSTFSGGQADNNANFAIRFNITASQNGESVFVDNIGMSGFVVGSKMIFAGEPGFPPTDEGLEAPTPIPPEAGTTAGDVVEMWQEMVRAALAIQQERDVLLQNDSWSQVPAAGDWAGLIFRSPFGAVLENAVVEFAQEGIRIANAADGTVEIRGCRVRSNWLGILCAGSRATIEATEIVNQEVSLDASSLPGTGINPSGSGMVCIQSAQPVVSYSTFSGNPINSVGILDTSRPSFGETGNASSPGRNAFRQPRGQNYMFNGTALTIYAQHNIWELLPGETVEDVIYDDTDNPQRGPIIWGPEGEDFTGVAADGWRRYE